jgi:hypothetical protein
MRWAAFAASAIALAAACGASAEDGPYRHFTRPAIDTNRNDRIIYAPVATAYPGARPGELPHDVSVATWYALASGQTAKPDKVLDNGRYVLERFETIRNGAEPALEVVISRYPAPTGGDVPLLRVVDRDSNISSAATPISSAIPGGVRYRFQVRPPLHDFAAMSNPGSRREAQQYMLRFLPARPVAQPAAMRRAGTFGGASTETVMSQGPPQLTVAERVAGKRLEFRSAKAPGVVVYDAKVAGKRQERRNR